MPISDNTPHNRPSICQMLDLLKAIRATQADIARLNRKLRVARGGRPLVFEQTKRDIAVREQRLADLDAALRAKTPTMFSAEQCKLPEGEDIKRRRGASGALITLHGGQDRGLCRLTIANVGLSEPLDLRCRPQDVNLIGFLLAEVLVADIHSFDDLRQSRRRSKIVRRKSARS